MSARLELLTPRLLLRAPSAAQQQALCDYQQRNAAHFAAWDPPYPPGHFEPARVAERQRQAELAFAAGTAYRYWFCLRDEPARVIGQAHLSQLARGPFQNAMLGYSLDAEAQGRGLMDEALRAMISEMFSPAVHLHRLQAAVRPENLRSRRVLERLGFEREGQARRYLFIDGAWRDHELFALLNPDWPLDLAPAI